MQDNELIEKLKHTADKLTSMWGRNPDSDIIREVAKRLEEGTQQKTTRTAKTTKKEQEQ